MDNQNNPVQSHILLDTCILQYLGNKDFGGELLAYLTSLVDQKHIFAISQISISELLANMNVTQEKEGIEKLNIFTQYLVDSSTLHASARLSTVYKLENINENQISVGDKIIASTAILTDSMILTSNVNDFPRPFFRTVDEKLIFFTKKNSKKMIVFQLLRPNYDILNQKFAERPTG